MDLFDSEPQVGQVAPLERAPVVPRARIGADFYLVDLRGAKHTRDQADHFARCRAILHDRGR